MANLVIRPSGQPAPREWSLQLRWHDSVGPTRYQTLCRMDRETAEDVIEAGRAEWPFGPPKDEPGQAAHDD